MFLISMRNLSIFILILGSAILIHELAHLLAAVLAGVRIKEIGLGLPPRMLKLGSIKNTEISLNWIPLGGFVRPLGEFKREVPQGFAASSPGSRIGILLAGPLGNLLFGFLILTAAFIQGGPKDDLVRVLEVFPDSPAEASGLLPGDIIFQVNGEPVISSSELSNSIQANIDHPTTFGIQRGEEVLNISLTPSPDRPRDKGAAGFLSMGAIVSYSTAEAVTEATSQIKLQVRETVRAIVGMVTGELSEDEARIAGPVGLKQASDWALENSIEWAALYPILYLSSIINVGLGLTNLLPLPALDGGRIFFVFLEILQGKPVSAKLEKIVHASGLVVLLGLMVVLSVNDVLDPLF